MPTPALPSLDLTRFSVLGDLDGWACRRCGGRLVLGPPPEANAIVDDPWAHQINLIQESAEAHARSCTG